MFIDTNNEFLTPTNQRPFNPEDPETFRPHLYLSRVTGEPIGTAASARNSSLIGPMAAGVPGAVAGMNEIVRRFGSGNLTLAEIIEPAILLAANGFPLHAGTASGINGQRANFRHFRGSRQSFMKNPTNVSPFGDAFAEGEIFKQPLLAETLKRIAQFGDDGFYRGLTADLIVADMELYGGIITHECLANYRPVWRDPVRGTYTRTIGGVSHTFNIYSMPPPSSGGTLIVQILNILQNAPIYNRDLGWGFNSPRTIHLMAEAMRYAFRDRGEYMADPDHAPAVLNYVRSMTSRAYARQIFDRITAQDGRAGPANPPPGFGDFNMGYTGGSGNHTTHYSVVDSLGNAVSITTTINLGYGNKMGVYGAGFLLNNEMDDLTAIPGQPNAFGVIQGWVNVPEPGKRPLSSMSPTIVTRDSDNSVFMVTGSPGGTRIITHTLHSIVNAIDHNMNISQAVSAPRFHLQWPTNNLERETFAESRWPQEIEAEMQSRGYTIAGAASAGDLSSIMIGGRTGAGRAVTGMHDPRVFRPPVSISFEELMEYVRSR